MNVELKSGIEAGRLLKRNPGKYLNRVKGLYLLSIADFKLGQIARSSYFLLREIDDLLDGDRHDKSYPLQYVTNIRSEIASGQFNKGSLSELAQHSIRNLEKRAKPGDNPTGDFLAAIDCMIFDHHRAKERRELSEKQLHSYYLRAFLPVLNLMLIGLKSNLRASDVPELAIAQGRIYSIRDLENDWPKGIINIPSEILAAASLSPASSLHEIQSSQTVDRYLSDQLIKGREDLGKLDQQLESNPEWLTIRVIKGLVKPMHKLIDRRLNTITTSNN